MTPEKLDEDKMSSLYALAKKATPGPWVTNHTGQTGPMQKNGFVYSVAEVYESHNRTYIAAASPDVVTTLIDRVRELEGALDNAVYLEPKLLRIANISNARAALNKEQK